MEAAAALEARDQVTVLVVDDHALFVDTVEALLSGEPRIAVVGRAGNGEDAARLAAQLRPDVVLMDISMPVMDGFEATERIRREVPGTCVLFLTGSNSPADIAKARASGGSGYVTKETIASDLVDAIRDAASASR